MLKVKKAKKPDFFNKWIKNNAGYSRALRKYMLEKEQRQVCCYCEKKISESKKDSHIDHIRPQKKFPELIHTYDNLTVSCQTKERCGRAKGNRFNKYFIVPTEESPGDYLTYSPNGEIRPIENNRRGRETIDILNLNAPKLLRARRALILVLRNISGSIDFDDFEKYFPEFPTFLRYFKENFLHRE